MKDRADALRLASVWVKVEMAASSLREIVSKPKLESDPMHDYGGNATRQQGPFCALHRRGTSLRAGPPSGGPRATLFQSRVA